ncbi:SusD/RagB family nutrient-binding outer membrane lipoprotein [Pedobacter nototheniae]|uniref:SusD/RagB family nutrient-binding outer membrane lipoprotein n=1 Tax=Pedobacter nototheniae TaxID=2488994 RepID=UPI001040765A|nr:SusD/RagB family nutrient-binding outer membrane lipoprotein [Pedobacter nototheniae]
MKTKLTYILFAGILTLCSCIKKDLNIDPTRSNENNFDPNYLLTTAQLDYGNISEDQLYELAPMVQVLSSTLDSYGGGDKYNLFLNSSNNRFFTNGMLASAKLLEAEFLAEKKDAESYSNLIQVSRIMWIMSMQRMTDIYGDIPYSEAGRAKLGIQYPKYDKQEDIYRDMLPKLETAILALSDDKSKRKVTGDLFYSGNIVQWRKFGYSLMLRIAMRLTKAAPDLAQQYAEKCAGKTFDSNADNALLHLDGTNDATQNRNSNALKANIGDVRWSSTFIDYLKKNDDPRLYVYTEKASAGLTNNENIDAPSFAYTKTIPAPGSFVTEIPMGMPNGYDLTGNRAITKAPGYPGPTGTGADLAPLGNYARPKGVFRLNKLPIFVITYSQTQLLLAEAKVRGWNVGASTAKDSYANGVTAAMQGLELLNGELTMGAGVQAYINTHPLNESSPEKALEDIASQYWIATLFDFPESWSNYRRTGYPALIPVNYPGNITGATIPRRLTYPLTENGDNTTNYQEALQRMGGKDVPTANVWWGK